MGNGENEWSEVMRYRVVAYILQDGRCHLTNNEGTQSVAHIITGAPQGGSCYAILVEPPEYLTTDLRLVEVRSLTGALKFSTLTRFQTLEAAITAARMRI